ncbi:MAG: phosphatidylserine decarboxylase family protein [Deltaproteobacteria bacterium]|jgi:phosphatidylserine decarboxylase|nr:phosphatidylserine decarboxylase family protein [Deltaproteobacteria bacterium]
MDKYSWSEPAAQTAFPVAKAGYPLIVAAAFVTLIFALLEMTLLAVLGVVVTFSFCGFFRDPDRLIPDQAGGIVAPADGKVIVADTVEGPAFFNGRCRKISIFMSVFNVHVNRIPFDGVVEKIRHHPGKFFAANLDKASLQNEHNAVFLKTPDNRTLCVVQVAGLIARRIICYVQPGMELKKGQRYGLICFGSRLDVYLPDDAEITVAVGDKVKAGTSLIGQFGKRA